MKTKSACLTGVNRIETRPRELTIGPDEVLVKTHLAGICGQDKNLYHGIRQRTLWTPLALRPVLRRQLAIEPLITHRFPISRVAEAFDVAANDPAAIKVVIEPDQP